MRDFWKYFDKLSFVTLLFLNILGVVLIYSASHTMPQSYHTRQLLWLVFALVAFFVVFRIKTEFFFNMSTAMYIFLAVILLVQYVSGSIIAGTKSWVRFGFFSAQFSEFAKIVVALVFARRLSKIDFVDWKVFLELLFWFGVPFVLIAAQPDMGTAFVLASAMIMTLFLKRFAKSILIFSLIFAIAGSYVTWNYVLKPYQKDRITSFLNPEKYRHSTGYQIIQSKIAIGSGGLQGKGYLKGSQSQYKFLPTRHTDFIVSVLGEEFGFLGLSLLFILFFTLFYRQFSFKSRTDEEFYFVYLFNGVVIFQFLINILMSIGLIPILGLPLPFVSYGGSSLLAFYIGEGLIFRIKFNNYLYET